MSGGAFNYDQYKIGYMVDQIEEIIVKNGVEKTHEELKNEGWKYPDEVIDKMKEGIEILKKAQIYAQRIDWLLSGDDGEESFLSRLEEDLNNLNNE
jgi:hypothetical protein